MLQQLDPIFSTRHSGYNLGQHFQSQLFALVAQLCRSDIVRP